MVHAKHLKLIGALLAVLLITAQARAMAHAHEHDAEAYQDSVCASCVTAGQLSSACVNSGDALDLSVFGAIHDSELSLRPASIHRVCARQRGPPVST